MILYGIWIPGQGWLRVGASVYAESHREIAVEVARNIGHNACVRYVDESITQLESAYLEQEKGNLWAILTSFKIFRKS